MCLLLLLTANGPCLGLLLFRGLRRRHACWLNPRAGWRGVALVAVGGRNIACGRTPPPLLRLLRLRQRRQHRKPRGLCQNSPYAPAALAISSPAAAGASSYVLCMDLRPFLFLNPRRLGSMRLGLPPFFWGSVVVDLEANLAELHVLPLEGWLASALPSKLHIGKRHTAMLRLHASQEPLAGAASSRRLRWSKYTAQSLRRSGLASGLQRAFVPRTRIALRSNNA